MPISRKPRGSRFFWLIAAIIVIAAFIAWRFFFKSQSNRLDMDMAAPPVRVAEAIVQNVPHYLNGLGTVIPSSDVLVQSRVDGQLLKLHFRDGQRVKVGDLLAEIDPRPFQAALEQARGNLLRDKAQLQNARKDLERYARLAKGDFIAEQQYENQKAMVKQYQGTVEADQAAVDSAALQVEYSKITAPVSGRLGLRAVDVGNQIKAGDAAGIVRITETEPCDVVFTLPENQIHLVASAMRKREKDPSMPPLAAQAWDREHKELLATGSLVSIDNQIDSATGTFKLKARFPNREHKLFPNQFVNIRLLAQTMDNAVTVPDAALQLGAKGSYCYVLNKEERGGKSLDIVEFRDVVPGISADGAQVIEKGIKAGEIVVVDGVDRLRNGIAARVAATVETPRIGQTGDAAANPAQPAKAPDKKAE